ncbi:DUF3800 domain-containing protein [Peptostreptococcus canis]|uniref:DUF3800 domain-containing protein n=1 Tax=Peptostreptococcus canis TaxID=1159213 RepID=A0ABR6TKC8_9FIRM|nr:DUF3800 domain-containing protein [Peptostreptococcus canis]MBC2575456.1 DUF3800 domain-containing protein [Peptostreptococcus canis]MBP1997352.1 hypothetical protein [Peptostreptococcus canis]
MDALAEKIYYFDESGTITTYNNGNHRFLIIAGLKTNNVEHTKRIFRKAKVKYLSKNPELELDVRYEIKGSQMNLDFKRFILEELIRKTDIKFSFIVFDNYHSPYKMRTKPAITFNYLMYLLMKHLIYDCDTLHINLDNRNVAIENLKSLQDYMTTKFCVEEDLLYEVRVSYLDSKENTMIQIADVFANFLWRLLKGKNNEVDQRKAMDLFNEIKIGNLEKCEYFPKSSCKIKEFLE